MKPAALDPWHNARRATREDALGETWADLLRYIPRGHGHFSLGNRVRTALLGWTGIRLGRDAVIYPDVTLICPARIRIGDDSFINRGCILSAYGGISIGDHTAIGYRVQIITETHDHQSDNFAVITKPVTIGDRVWLGSGAILLPGVTVGDGAVVAAGAVVSKNIEPGDIVGGIPARVLKAR